MSDSQERTEAATDKRMKEVRSKGKLSKSQDLTTWLGLGAAALLLPATITQATNAAVSQIFAVGKAAGEPSDAVALGALGAGMSSILPTIALLLVAVAVAVFAGSALQGGIHLRKLEGKFEQFNVVNGFKHTFGGQALWNGAKALLKTGVVGLALYLVIQSLLPVLMVPGSSTLSELVDRTVGGITALLQTAIIFGLLLAAVDVFVVMRRNRKQTRMTKREVRDENKTTDGDPLIKSQRRSRQLAMSRNRMMAAIADADVVLINPTHFAVALRYEPGKSAPRVVAKGAGVIAARIRDEAEAKKVPMVKDIPLTRTLHAACDIGHEIPVEFYNAIAHVLTFVMALKRRGSASGVHTLPYTSPRPEGATR